MLRASDIGKGVDAVRVDAQGTTVFCGWLFWVAHSHAPGSGIEGQQQAAKHSEIAPHFIFHPVPENDFSNVGHSL